MTQRGDAPQDTSVASRLSACASLPECRRLVHLIRARHLQTVAIHSQFAGEGKTFLTALLAESAFRFADFRVLIIDAVSTVKEESFFSDKSPSSSGIAKIDVTLAKTLRKEQQLTHTPHSVCREGHMPYRVGVSDFDVGTYVATVKNSYDLILIDCCSLTAITSHELHPAILACHSDSNLIVTAAHRLKRRALTSLKILIAHYNLALLGVVCNGGGRQ